MAWQAVTSFTWSAADTAGTNYDVPFTAPDADTKLVTLYIVGRGTDGAARGDLILGAGGFISATERRATGFFSGDALATGDSRNGVTDVACLVYFTATTTAGLLDAVSLGDGTFRVTVDDQAPTDLLVIAVVYGGSDFTVYPPVNCTANATPQTHTVTGFVAGATDQAILCFGTNRGAPGGGTTSNTDAWMTIGLAHGSNSFVTACGSNDGSATMVSRHHGAQDACYLSTNGGVTAGQNTANVSSWDTDGFTVTWTNVSTAQAFVAFPIKCANMASGTFETSTSTGALTAVSGFGFTPSGIGVFSCCGAELTGTSLGSHALLSAGWLDSNGNLAAMALSDINGAADSECFELLDADGSVGDIYNAVDSSGKYAGLSVALDADGFTPTQNDADTVASFAWWLAVGSTGGGGGDPAAIPRRALLGVGF